MIFNILALNIVVPLNVYSCMNNLYHYTIHDIKETDLLKQEHQYIENTDFDVYNNMIKEKIDDSLFYNITFILVNVYNTGYLDAYGNKLHGYKLMLQHLNNIMQSIISNRSIYQGVNAYLQECLIHINSPNLFYAVNALILFKSKLNMELRTIAYLITLQALIIICTTLTLKSFLIQIIWSCTLSCSFGKFLLSRGYSEKDSLLIIQLISTSILACL